MGAAFEMGTSAPEVCEMGLLGVSAHDCTDREFNNLSAIGSCTCVCESGALEDFGVFACVG